MRVRGVLVTVPVLLVAMATMVPAASAVTRARPVGARPAGSFAARGVLNDVAALSPRSAWAVGRVGVCEAKSLIARWNGRAWERTAIPAGARQGWLNGVVATSSRNAWAVGFSGPLDGARRSLLLHWDGTAWRRIGHPGAIGGVSLSGVAATSSRHAWVVGYTGHNKVYILRWDGRVWRRVRAPSPKGGAALTGVAATSTRNVWVIGAAPELSASSLIMHWNGAKWTLTPVPDLPGGIILQGVATTSADRAWAVGLAGDKTLILRWNGAAWRRAKGAAVVGGLVGVTTVSARDAWAVGGTSIFFSVGCPASAAPAARRQAAPAGIARLGLRLAAPADRQVDPTAGPLIFHWNGTAWRQVTSPALKTGGVLIGAAATSPGNAWAVGSTNLNRPNTPVLLLRWNGRIWK